MKTKNTLSNEQIKYIELSLPNIIKVIESTEEYTSRYHLKLTEYKLEQNNNKIIKLTDTFNEHFKKFADKFYKEAVNMKLIY